MILNVLVSKLLGSPYSFFLEVVLEVPSELFLRADFFFLQGDFVGDHCEWSLFIRGIFSA